MTLKIAVCVKQVPQASEVTFDLERKSVLREGVPLTLNAFDRRAVTEALRLKEAVGGEVVAITMGPPQAREVLVECLSLGCDRAIHVCDPALAGSDSLITARVLAAAVRPEGFDLVFCGKYSVDAETGQVGPELAELLGWPQITGATSVTLTENPRSLSVERETDEDIDIYDVPLPAVLTAAERLCKPLKTEPEAMEAAAARHVQVFTAADLGFGPAEVGVAASPTVVSDIRAIEIQRERQLIADEADSSAERLVDFLDKRGLLDAGREVKHQPLPFGWRPRLGGPAIWVVAELIAGKMRAATLELLGKGAELAAELNGELAAVLVGGPGVRKNVSLLAGHGAARVYLAEADHLAAYQVEPYAALITRLINTRQPRTVLFSATSLGRDLAPRIAARLGLGLTADCVGVDLQADGRIAWLKPAFGGLVVAPILCRTTPELATVRPGMLPRPEALASPNAEVVELVTEDLPRAGVSLVASRADVGTAGAALDEAATVVCVGSGLGGPESLPTIGRLAEQLGGAIGGTRKVVDYGWLPRQQQIGLTGKAVAPELYVGIGISGGFNHTIGIMRAGTIVAINNDPEAGIFQMSDFGIVGDWREIVPAVTRALRQRMSRSVPPAASHSASPDLAAR